MSVVPKAYPRVFRDDVVAGAQRREPGVTIKEIANDFGVSGTRWQNWLRQADVEAGRKPGMTSPKSAELRKRNRLL
jgi:transposase